MCTVSDEICLSNRGFIPAWVSHVWTKQREQIEAPGSWNTDTKTWHFGFKTWCVCDMFFYELSVWGRADVIWNALIWFWEAKMYVILTSACMCVHVWQQDGNYPHAAQKTQVTNELERRFNELDFSLLLIHSQFLSSFFCCFFSVICWLLLFAPSVKTKDILAPSSSDSQVVAVKR